MKIILLLIGVFLAANAAFAQTSGDKQKIEAANRLVAEMNKLTFVFEKGKPALAPASQDALQKLAALFRKLPAGAIVLIENHVSEMREEGGSLLVSEKLLESEAKILSINRNIEIAAFLLKAGVADNSFKLNGQGFKKPIASNDTAEGRAKNARVEFSLHPDSFKTAAAANQPAPVPADRITFNKGWGKIVIGAAEKDAAAALGNPEKEFFDAYLSQNTLYYPQKGLKIVTDLSKITELTFYGDASVNPIPKDINDSKVKYTSFAAPPDKLSWRAGKESVIAAYGKPDDERRDSEYPSSGSFTVVTLLRYGSTWLYFKDNKLYKIIISGK